MSWTVGFLNIFLELETPIMFKYLGGEYILYIVWELHRSQQHLFANIMQYQDKFLKEPESGKSSLPQRSRKSWRNSNLGVIFSLHSLFGNKLCDHGVLTLLNGIAEVQEQTARMGAAIQQSQSAQQNATLQLPTGGSSFKLFALVELDIGGNGLSSNGVRLLASYMRHYSQLQYLGLAQTSSADLAAWKELFDNLKGNRSLIHIILDENNLGDPGVRLLAEVLKENRSLRQVDLDKNGISDLGGNDIMGALLCRLDFPLRHLGLEENNISAGLLSRIQEEVKYKWIRQRARDNPIYKWGIGFNIMKFRFTLPIFGSVCLQF